MSFASPDWSWSLGGTMVTAVANPTWVRWRPCLVRICSVWCAELVEPESSREGEFESRRDHPPQVYRRDFLLLFSVLRFALEPPDLSDAALASQILVLGVSHTM